MKNPDIFVVFNQSGNVASATPDKPDWHISPSQRVVEYVAKTNQPDLQVCDFEGCQHDPTVVLPDGQKMCRFHATDSLLSSLTLEETRMIRNLFEKQFRDA